MVVGSYSVSNILVAVLVVFLPAIAALATAVMVKVAESPLARNGTVQLPLLYVPVDGVTTTFNKPAGIISSIMKLVAASGPIFIIDTM